MPTKKATVLFAEDNPGDRIPIVDYLEARGYEVIPVVDPQQAIKCLDKYESAIDVLVLDLAMPDNNPEGGEQVLRFMRDSTPPIPTPVIIASAFGYNGPAERAKATYPEVWRATLTKTFLPAELLTEIEKIVREKPKAEKESTGVE